MLTTTHLPQLRKVLEKWEKSQPPPKDFSLPLAEVSNTTHAKENAKDMVVAFRTRPPLPDEAASKFKGNDEDADKPTSDDTPSAPELAPEVEFCAGITVASAEPGVFVAHVPGMKVLPRIHVDMA